MEDVKELSEDDAAKYLLGYYSTLNIQLQNDLVRYTTSKYSELNDLLNNGLDPELDHHVNEYPKITKWIKGLDTAIGRAPRMPKNFYVYRGIKIEGDEFESLELSGYINNFGYMSTTLSTKIARSFSLKGCCLLKVLVYEDDDLNYCYIPTRKGKISGEKEIIFERGTHLELIRKVPSTPTIYIVRLRKKIRVLEVKTTVVTPTENSNKIIAAFKKFINDVWDDRDILYEDDEEMIDDFIVSHKHYIINEGIRTILLKTLKRKSE